MKHSLTKFFYILLFSVTGLPGVLAQQTVLTSGGHAAGGGTCSYSVGQVVYLIKTDANHTLAEGIQLPFEILVPEGINDGRGITLECIIYPNPTDRYVMLKIKDHETRDLAYQLSDVKGSRLREAKIGNNETLIPMDGLERASYFLTITENEKILKSFQVIKK